MNSIEQMGQRLMQALPNASFNIVPPALATGSWWLDAYLHAQHVVVEWRPQAGFGVSTPSSDDYGDGADEIYTDSAAAFERLRDLLLSRARTGAPQALSLH